MKAVPIDKKETSDENRKMRRLSRTNDEGSMTFGGHPSPNLGTPYQVTVREKKDAFHAICMMKVSHGEDGHSY